MPRPSCRTDPAAPADRWTGLAGDGVRGRGTIGGLRRRDDADMRRAGERTIRHTRLWTAHRRRVSVVRFSTTTRQCRSPCIPIPYFCFSPCFVEHGVSRRFTFCFSLFRLFFFVAKHPEFLVRIFATNPRESPRFSLSPANVEKKQVRTSQ